MSLRISDENPVFTKPRVVPFAVRSKYEEALEKLVGENIIEIVEHSKRASPIVPIVKANGDLTICQWGLFCHHQQVFQTYSHSLDLQIVFVKIASPLYGLLRKEVPWRWPNWNRMPLIT